MTESNFLLVQNKLSPVVWWVCSAHFPQCLPARNIRRQQTQVIWITFCCGIFWFLLLYPRNVVVRDWEYNRLFPLYLSLPLSSDGFPYWLFESHSQGDIEETSHFPLTVFWTEREREINIFPSMLRVLMAKKDQRRTMEKSVAVLVIQMGNTVTSVGICWRHQNNLSVKQTRTNAKLLWISACWKK